MSDPPPIRVDREIRYRRQQRVSPNGPEVDARWSTLRVLIVGLGGTGAPLAAQLVRSGVGALTLLDPDTVDESNLARQSLYTSGDAQASRSKVSAALVELSKIGGRTALDGRAIALTPSNADTWVEGVDLVIDATDHLPARLWIDQSCRALRRPWIHLAAIEDRYRVIGFLHPQGPCFRCYCPEIPPPEVLGTCETRGVLPMTTQLAAAHGAAFAWRAVQDPLTAEDACPALDGRVGEIAPRSFRLPRDPDCPGCGTPSMSSRDSTDSLRLLCGSSRAEGWRDGSQRSLEAQLGTEWRVDDVNRGKSWLRVSRESMSATLFEDGRVHFGPVENLDEAKRLWQELFPPRDLGRSRPPRPS